MDKGGKKRDEDVNPPLLHSFFGPPTVKVVPCVSQKRDAKLR